MTSHVILAVLILHTKISDLEFRPERPAQRAEETGEEDRDEQGSEAEALEDGFVFESLVDGDAVFGVNLGVWSRKDRVAGRAGI